MDCLEQPKPFGTYEQVLKVSGAKSSQGGERKGHPKTSVPEVGVMDMMAGGTLAILVMVVKPKMMVHSCNGRGRLSLLTQAYSECPLLSL